MIDGTSIAVSINESRGGAGGRAEGRGGGGTVRGTRTAGPKQKTEAPLVLSLGSW